MKKILLFVFLAFLIIIPAGKVGAAQYFVGVVIASAQAPGYPSPATNNNWCLPKGTTLAIRNSGGTNLTPIAPTTNPTEISLPGCSGRTIWSGLFNLTTATTYQVYIQPGINATNGNYYYAYCSGSSDGNYNGQCLVTWPVAGQNKNCVEICAYYNSTPFSSEMHIQNCTLENFLMGTTCSSCTANAIYNYFEPSTSKCYYTTANGASSTARLGATLERVCNCYIQNNYSSPAFTFTFTPNF